MIINRGQFVIADPIFLTNNNDLNFENIFFGNSYTTVN